MTFAASRRAERSPFFAKVINFSTSGLTVLALATVVRICRSIWFSLSPWRRTEVAKLDNKALRWAAGRPRRLSLTPCFIFYPSVVEVAIDVDAKTQTQSLKDLVYFDERRATEVLVLEHVLLGVAHQVGDRVDVRHAQAIARPDRQFEFIDAHLEDARDALAFAVVVDGIGLLQLALEVDEQLEVVHEKFRGVGQRIFRCDGPVGVDLQRQLVEVRFLSNRLVLPHQVPFSDW